jgi:hypothetical protein
MIEPGAVCANCGKPAAARSGIFNKIYKCGDCHSRDEKRGWLLALLGCGGCLLIALMMVIMGCGVAVGVTMASRLVAS